MKLRIVLALAIGVLGIGGVVVVARIVSHRNTATQAEPNMSDKTSNNTSVTASLDSNDARFVSFPQGAEFGTERILTIDQSSNLTTEGTISTKDLYIGGIAYVDTLNLSDSLYVSGSEIIDTTVNTKPSLRTK